MSLVSSVSSDNDDELRVEVPSTRPDILHECDIMEDAAIAYGFNNLPKSFPKTNTVAQPLAVSRLSDLVRREWALAGWVEVLPLILVSTGVLSVASSLDTDTICSARTKKISNGLTASTMARKLSKLLTPKPLNFKSSGPP